MLVGWVIIYIFRMLEVLGYDSEDLIGQSVYGYHHAMDSDAICSGFKSCKYIFSYIYQNFAKKILTWIKFYVNANKESYFYKIL